MHRYRNREKKFIPFTKKHTVKEKQNVLKHLTPDIELHSKIKEYKNTIDHYLSIEPKYINFLKEYEPLLKEFKLLEEQLNNSYRNLKRDFIKETGLFFVKYDRHDVYFLNQSLEKEFFSLYEEAAKYFSRKYNLFSELNLHYVYLFPKGTNKDYVIHWNYSRDWCFILTNLNDDIYNYSDLYGDKKYNLIGVYNDSRPMCTNRTYALFSKILQVSKDHKFLVDNKWVNCELPNLVKPSYVNWYFKKLIDETNKEIRKIELILRSRKRKVELADNLHFVYVMSNQAYTNIYKIGWTSSLPEERAEELTGTGHLHPFKVEYFKKVKNAEKIEQQCHEYFKKNRVVNNREFFEVPLKEIKDYMDSIK
jgi:hypothetical protein